MKHQVTAVYVILHVLMFSAVSTGLELRTKLINTPFLVPKEVVHILSCAMHMKHQVTSVYVILRVLMFSAVRTGHELRPNLINTPFLVLSWIIQLVV